MKISTLCLLFAGALLIGRFALKQTDRWSVEAIRSHRSYNPEWEGRALSTEEAALVKEALSLKYRYYGRGGQAFIFFSENERYVLKFFKQKVFATPFYLDYLPPLFQKYKEKKRWKKADKLKRDFASYTYAFNNLSDLTGVLYIHLNSTSHLQREIILKDKLGIEHRISLDHFDFIVQRKAEFVYDRIQGAMQAGQKKRAQEAITQIMELIIERCKRGFHDRDPNISTNCGFLEEKCMKIDVGRFVFNERMKDRSIYAKELLKITAPLREWIAAHHPFLLDHFDKERGRLCEGQEL